MTREELIRNLKYTMEKHKNDTVNTFGTNISDMCKDILDYLEQEPISVSVSEKEPDEISEEVTLRFFRNTLKVRWQDLVIYNVEWLKKNWQMEMDIVCGVKPCDDVVSRQAVLEIAKQHTLTNDYLAIQELPPVRPQEQTGHWVIIDDCEKFIAKCSECGQIEDSRMIGKYAYCHCGARMVEPREREDKE